MTEDWLRHVRLAGPSTNQELVAAEIRRLYSDAGLDLPAHIEFGGSPVQAILKALVRYGLKWASLTQVELPSHIATRLRQPDTDQQLIQQIRGALMREVDNYFGTSRTPRMMVTTFTLVTSAGVSMIDGLGLSNIRSVADYTAHWGQHGGPPETLRNNAGWILAFPDVVYVCDRVFIRTETRRPQEVWGRTAFRAQERTVLHCESGPAIQFADGFVRWAWRGVPVPQEVISLPSQDITLDHVLLQENAEAQSALLSRAGPGIWDDSRVRVIDRDRDSENERRLVQVARGSSRLNAPRTYLLVTCPSTGRHYALAVPPDSFTCSQAAAWTFGMDRQEYAPTVER